VQILLRVMTKSKVSGKSAERTQGFALQITGFLFGSNPFCSNTKAHCWYFLKVNLHAAAKCVVVSWSQSQTDEENLRPAPEEAMQKCRVKWSIN
jgi:hypothetical protein